MGNNLVTFCPTDKVYGFNSGNTFADNFEVDESAAIGAGKFSEVYMCWKKQQPEQRYALKVINIRNEDQQGINRIYEEIKIMKILGHHPSLVQLIDCDEAISSVRVVLEFCEGGELYDRIQQRTCYPEADAITLLGNLCEAVAYIHSRGIMHRDLKPENILLVSKNSDTDIKISDFGLAKASKDFPRKLPRSNSICGSDFYLAPEVIKQEEYGREIDVWSIGIIAYVLCSGSLPFFHSILHKLYRQIVERELSFPPKLWTGVSDGAKDFILRLLTIRPGDRLSAETALMHPWLKRSSGGYITNKEEHGQGYSIVSDPLVA